MAIFLVTSSKGGISAMELKRQMGFGSYQTAWTWLHKIRKAMVRPERAPLAERVEADETYVGGPRPGRPGRGAAGKTRALPRPLSTAVPSTNRITPTRLFQRLALPQPAARASLNLMDGQFVLIPAGKSTDGMNHLDAE